MSVSPILGSPKPQFLDNNGDPLSGGMIEFYASGGATPLATYTSSTGAVANSNPVVLSSRGEPPAQIHGTDDVSYKAVLKDSTGVVIWTEDVIYSAGTSSAAAAQLFLNATLEKNAAYTVVAVDAGKLIRCVSNSFTVTLLPAATATEGFLITVTNDGDGVITVDADAAELINGALTIALQPGENIILTSSGTAWNGPRVINGLAIADAAGTVDVMTADFAPNLTLTDGVIFQLKPVGQITSTTPTLAIDSLIAKTIVKGNDTALNVIDIVGSSQTLLLQYDSTLDKFILLNPSIQGFRGCLVGIVTSFTSIATSSLTTLGWDLTAYDTDSIHDDVTNNSRLTVPTGVTRVRITTHIAWVSSGLGERFAHIRKDTATNNLADASSVIPAATLGGVNQNVTSGVYIVTGGDYFEVTVQQTSGGGLNISGGGVIPRCWAQMEILE